MAKLGKNFRNDLNRSDFRNIVIYKVTKFTKMFKIDQIRQINDMRLFTVRIFNQCRNRFERSVLP